MNKCVHHWKIEMPSGSTSIGTCKFCGEKKKFSNYIEFASYWEVAAEQRRRIKEQEDNFV